MSNYPWVYSLEVPLTISDDEIGEYVTWYFGNVVMGLDVSKLVQGSGKLHVTGKRTFVLCYEAKSLKESPSQEVLNRFRNARDAKVEEVSLGIATGLDGKSASTNRPKK